ncbi:MAG: hypothetical protein M2R45_04695 [Verrucomicrobia subdivision 3 bacterium]|nr:hypothetical protein [Limisphaerales bacterium]MCS1416282.1 hypothetical protein [Limisphaerales bacterium]
MAHATDPWRCQVVEDVRPLSSELKQPVAIVMDIKEPVVRTGPLEQPIEPIEVPAVYITVDPALADAAAGGACTITSNYSGVVSDVSVDNTLFIDNGLITAGGDQSRRERTSLQGS